ncbi:hypothetical protein FRC01_006761 [Tulasnella sp. 417]|nr:hypothetical protein FRC01_006761 [Tulasnella sp. 417]
MEAPPRKKLRPDNDDELKPTLSGTSGLFAPFRALGFITNHVPFVMQVHSAKGAAIAAQVNIVTCVGRSWAMWSGDAMKLLFVGTDAPSGITSLAMIGEDVWAASGLRVIKYVRGKQAGSLSNPFDSTLSTILPFGSLILALTLDGRHLLVWNTVSSELESHITFDNDFTATQILHPATYINKILVASAEGGLQLWNIRTKTCIYRFDPKKLQDSPKSNSPCSITAVTQSPAIDVVGLGFSTGEVSIYDVRTDERLLRMHMEGGGIRSISFRADGQPVLATASASGNIALWDLNAGGRLLHMIHGAHDGAVTSIQWVPGQALLISSGEDNSLKQWLFDTPTGPPRLLKSRSGHHGPPHLIRYYGEDGKTILTASRDRSLRATSVVRDTRSHELSQGSLAKRATSLNMPVSNLKFPPITSISYSNTRSKDWEDVVTTHQNEAIGRTWHVQNKRCGRWLFKLPEKIGDRRVDPGVAKTSAVSACGNFGIVGSSTGTVQMWNMESGLPKKLFKLPDPPDEQASSGRKSIARSVTGIATDALNRVVIVSTLDGTVNFFDFHTTELQAVMVLPSSITSIALQGESGLLAVICDDLFVRLVDVETQRVVREMTGFKGRILDLAFSPDSRWLITTSLDSIIRTFDIPTGRLIDGFKTPSVATSVTFSPTGDFLATAHVDSVGVFLWADRAQYTEVSLKSIREEDILEIGMPSVQGLAEDESIEAIVALTASDPQNVYSTPAQLDSELMTLTFLPRSKWQTLLNIEVIQQRNKPKEPPKPLEQAPFFLPTLPGVEHRFDLSKPTKEGEAEEVTTSPKRLVSVQSEFVRKLSEESVDGNYESFFSHLKVLSPAAIDVEIRSLSGIQELLLFIGALTARLQSHRDFEAVQTLIKVFFRVHGEMVVANDELQEPVEALLKVQRTESSRLLDLVSASLGTLAFVRDAV